MAAAPATAPRRETQPHPPRPARPRPVRRVSGPATRPPRPPRSAATARAAAPGVALPVPGAPIGKVLAALRALPDAKWLDRLIRGQGWIVIIGIALMGIVAMQVSLLKMNAGIGHSIERAGSLERQNADLRAEVSRLSSEGRIASVAEGLGLVMPAAGDVRYARVRGERDARKAADIMRAPDPVEQTAATTAATAATPTAEATTPGDPAASADPATAAAPATPTTPATGTTAAPTPATPAQPTQPTQPAATAGATAAPAAPTATPGQ